MTRNTLPRTMFVTGLAYGTKYIGPMQGADMIQLGGDSGHGRGEPVIAGGLPYWVPAANTVATIPEANTFASINPGESAANGWSYNISGVSNGSIGFAKIINDFSGGVYNPYLGAKGSIIYHGGGHAATNWNGIVAFDLDTLLYSIWMGGTTNAYTADTVNCEYADGQPMSPHSYDTLAIIGPEAGYSKGALITPIRVAAAFESYNSTAVHLFDFNNPGIKWTRLAADNAAFPKIAGAAAAYDPDLGRVWWVCNTHQSGYQQYFDLADNTQKKVTLTFALSLQEPSADSLTLRYDSARHILVLIYVRSSAPSVRRVYYLDTTNPTTGWVAATLSGATLPAPTAGLAFAFDREPSGTYICYSKGDPTKLHRLALPAVLTDPWVVTEITPAGAAFATLSTGTLLGKRWSYVPALESIVCKFTATAAHQIYKV